LRASLQPFQGVPASPPCPPKAVSSQVADLRLHRSRHLAERLAARAGLLPLDQRLLLEQLYVHGWPASRIAALRGDHVRTVRRRAKRLATRVMSAAFELVAAHSHNWAPESRAVGQAVFIRGLSARAAAAELGIGYRTAALHARTIRAMAKVSHKEPAKRGAA
jgi:DNA-directed RNA polymerase specialized sigma24 family protein